MMTDKWPSAVMIKRNKPTLEIHQALAEDLKRQFENRDFGGKLDACLAIGGPDYLCRKSGEGDINWDFVIDLLNRSINGDKPPANGDIAARDRFERDQVHIMCASEPALEALQSGLPLEDFDPRERRRWSPHVGLWVAGWISNRSARTSVMYQLLEQESRRMDDGKRRKAMHRIAGAYDARVIVKRSAQDLILQVLRPQRPLTLEDLISGKG